MSDFFKNLLGITNADLARAVTNPNLLGVDTSMDAVNARRNLLGSAYDAVKTQHRPQPYSAQEFFRRAGAGEPQDPAVWDDALQVATLMGPIKAYHGSPHTFEKFDSSKIGTGEGAQAYGHGLYFAENPKVAESYQTSNSATANIHYDGNPITNELERSVAWHLAQHGGNKDAVIKQWREQYKPSYFEPGKQGAEEMQILANMDPSKLRPGSMYEVQINAEPEQMLDWDKPLSEQPPQVRQLMSNIPGVTASKATSDAAQAYSEAYNSYQSRPIQTSSKDLEQLERAVSDAYAKWQSLRGLENHSGAGIYRELSKNDSFSSGADILRNAGIPGIKYLDQGSRGSGQGTSNYVVFDPSLIEILKRY